MYGHSIQVSECFKTCTDTVRSVRSGGYARLRIEMVQLVTNCSISVLHFDGLASVSETLVHPGRPVIRKA